MLDRALFPQSLHSTHAEVIDSSRPCHPLATTPRPSLPSRPRSNLAVAHNLRFGPGTPCTDGESMGTILRLFRSTTCARAHFLTLMLVLLYNDLNYHNPVSKTGHKRSLTRLTHPCIPFPVMQRQRVPHHSWPQRCQPVYIRPRTVCPVRTSTRYQEKGLVLIATIASVPCVAQGSSSSSS